MKHLGLGCHVGLTYAGAFGYDGDIALVLPFIYGLKKMTSICETYAQDYHNMVWHLNQQNQTCYILLLVRQIYPQFT